MDNKTVATEFNVANRLECFLQMRFNFGDTVTEQIVADVSGCDLQQRVRLILENVRINEVGVFGDENPRFCDGESSELQISGSVSTREIERVNRVMTQ